MFRVHICRAIIEEGKHEKFLEHLEQRIKSHDRDIEKLCNAHYQGFIDSIRELLHVRSEAQDLKVTTCFEILVILVGVLAVLD